MSNGKPIKEILPEVIRKLIIQRKHYLKQQRINRRKKNRDPNQPKLPGMKQGGKVAKKNNRKRREFESPYHGRWSVSKETFEEAKKDVGDIKGKAHHLKAHKKEGKKRLKKIKKKSDYSPFYSEKVLKSAFPDRDKGWGGKHSRKIEHNANGGTVVDVKAGGGRVRALWKGKAKDYPGVKKVIKLNKLGRYKKPVKKAKGGFVKGAGGTKRVPGSGAATKGTNFEGIF